MRSTFRILAIFLLFLLPIMAIGQSQQQKALAVLAAKQYKEGMNLESDRQFEAALSCMEKARAGFQAAGEIKFEMKSLYRIGVLKKYLYDYKGSLAAFKEAEELATDDGDKMEMMAEQRSICATIGDNEALAAVSNRMEQLSAHSNNVLLMYAYNEFRGKQALNESRYKDAERWFLQNERLLPLLTPDYRYSLYIKLWVLYSNTGEWEKAHQYANSVKEDAQGFYKPSEVGYYMPYGDIADTYRRQGDSLSCFLYLDSLSQAIPLTMEPRELLHIYRFMAYAHSSFGNPAKALDSFRTADSLLATKYGDSDKDRVGLLAQMAGMEFQCGNVAEAERLYRRYAENIKALTGENSTSYIDALNYQANAEAFAGHLEAAANDYTEAARRLKQQVRSKWPYLTSSEREGYWRTVSDLFLDMTPFALKAGEFQTPFTVACYDNLILTKAFLLASEQSTYELIKHHGTQDDLEAFSKIQALQGKIRFWESRDGNKAFADSIIRATSAISRLETPLAKRCQSYGDATAYMSVDYASIKQALGKNDVLLDFTDFVSESRGRVYAAYVVQKNQDHPVLKELFKESSIDSLNARYSYQYYSGTKAKRILSLLWEPLKEYVKEDATVYYIPSQFLFQIAPESLPLEDGTLLGDHYNFVRLSSARELTGYSSSMDNSRSDAVLYGDLLYNSDAAGKQESGEAVRGDLPFNYLPGTKREILDIENILQHKGIAILPKTGTDGTTASFFSLNRSAPHILHIATHGFYYTPNAARKIDYLRGYTDAMSLSGLVFADGILTAADISKMDLSGIEMVVLSACHSGKGEATPEGLYGLQRAFKKAGVKTIVMSLWAESEVVGPEFMAEFYRNLAGQCKWDKRAAFTRAKKTIGKKYHDTPSYWAGFIMLD
ncbi:MAG: CHAT domain-containing protein [Bacteroidales bacterium]|nr:CHAT domain-containing protein [Bacteroidales bacterium]